MLNFCYKIQTLWYNKKPNWLIYLLLPIAGIYWLIITIRSFAYRFKLLASYKLKIPTVIVGNITVGGTGKTPVVIYLVKLLQEYGFNPGVISRGYKGKAKQNTIVTATSAPEQVGDEPLLIVKRTKCPLVVGKNKVAAAKYLQAKFPVDVIISDDGLQHYALQRDIELVVIDGIKRFGNGFCLPAGPLRELPSRLNTVTAILINGGQAVAGEYPLQILGTRAYNLKKQSYCELSAFSPTLVHAVAGIAEPNKFFQLLQQNQLTIIPHIFPDHHQFLPAELEFADDLPIIMTEKDAVKCLKFANEKFWCLPIEVKLSYNFNTWFLQLLNKIKSVKEE